MLSTFELIYLRVYPSTKGRVKYKPGTFTPSTLYFINTFTTRSRGSKCIYLCSKRVQDQRVPTTKCGRRGFSYITSNKV